MGSVLTLYNQGQLPLWVFSRESLQNRQRVAVAEDEDSSETQRNVNVRRLKPLTNSAVKTVNENIKSVRANEL
jgi:hypothetical protein